MRRFLPFAALLGVALVLGCQDVGTGPDGLVPQFAKGGKPGKPGGGGGSGSGGNLAATLDLEGGMMVAGLEVTGKDDDTRFRLSTLNLAVPIKMNFAAIECTIMIGAGMVPTELAYLLEQLQAEVTVGSIHLSIDKASLTVGGTTTNPHHLLNVNYEGELDGHTVSTMVRFENPFSQVDDATVAWTKNVDGDDVFEFTGPIVVVAEGVGGRNGSRGSRAIACGGNGAN